MPRYPWNDGSNQPDICNRPTLPKKYWIDDPASILPLPPSGRGIDDLRGARESVRVGESLKISFWTGWSVTGWTYAKKWRRRIGVGTVNSRETILPWRKDLLLLLLWNEISPHVPVPGSRLPLCQQDFFPPLFLPFVPTRGWMYLKIFSPSSVPFPWCSFLWKAIALFALCLFQQLCEDFRAES